MTSIAEVAEPVTISGSATSYFSAPEDHLDPNLFDGDHLRGSVRNSLLEILFSFLNERFMHAELWCTVWIAGSGVSYQWSAARSPGDLDVLIGVDYVQFRRTHPNYVGLTNYEISQLLNEDLRTGLQPETENWDNLWEVTFYVNSDATDIRSINPYAAYNLTQDDWTVFPSAHVAPENKEWTHRAAVDTRMTLNIINRYSQALTNLQGATNDPARRSAENALQQAMAQGSALFEDIHHGRKYAFSPSGAGYDDFNNYRWQAGKASGAVGALKKLHDYLHSAKESQEKETYGIELPDSRTLIRRAALYRSNG